MMDLQHGRQKSVNCDLCENPDHPLYCETCQINLCRACVGNHLDSPVRHQIIPFEKKDSALIFSICKEHSPKQCELHCEECNVFICVHCVTSSNHKDHKIVDAKIKFESKKVDLQTDLHEFQNFLSTKYFEIEKDITALKSKLNTHFNKLASTLQHLREQWYGKIDETIAELHNDLFRIKSNLRLPLIKQERNININISEINQSILDIKHLLQSDEVCQVSAYRTNIAKFRKLPPRLEICLPTFSPPTLYFSKSCNWRQFKTFSDSYITTDERGYITETTAAGAFPLKQFLDKPLIVKSIKTEYKGFVKELHSVSCNDKSEFWTCGKDCIIKLYNLQAKLLDSVKTESANEPWDVATTTNGELVYTDPNNKSVNIVKYKKVENVLRLYSWRPRNVCCTADGDLLVMMDSSTLYETKVVRYSAGSKEKQCIQFNDKNQPLFSFGDIKYLSENRNLDICVADYGAHTVVVVN